MHGIVERYILVLIFKTHVASLVLILGNQCYIIILNIMALKHRVN